MAAYQSQQQLTLGELWAISGESAVVIRFYGGGANSMRGFSERRLSPLLQVPILIRLGQQQ